MSERKLLDLSKIFGPQITPPITAYESPRLQKNKKKRIYLDIARKAEKVQNGLHKEQIKTWFKSLETEGRLKVVTFNNVWLVSMIRTMFSKLIQNGTGIFQLTDQQVYSDKFEDCFYFQKRQLSFLQQIELNNSEKSIEENVRLSESGDSLDILTLSASFLNDVDYFFECFKIISEDQAFTSPVKFQWDSQNRNWIWEMPC